MQSAGSPASSATSSASSPTQDQASGALAEPSALASLATGPTQDGAPDAPSALASLATGPTQDGAPDAPPDTPSALAALAAFVAGQGAPPQAILLQRPPPVRRLELAALIAIIALADLALYQGGGGAGLALLFAGVPAILFVASETRTRSARLASIAAILA